MFVRNRSIVGLFLFAFGVTLPMAALARLAHRPKISILVYDSGFAPRGHAARRGRETLRRYYRRADGQKIVQSVILTVGLHGQMVVEEISAGVGRSIAVTSHEMSPAEKDVEAILRRYGRADLLDAKPATHQTPGLLWFRANQVGLRAPIAVQEYYENHFNRMFYDAIQKFKTPPEIVNLSIGFRSNEQSWSKKKFHQNMIRGLVKKWVMSYPATLFVAAAGNEGCALNDTRDYNWSGVKETNLVVVGACDRMGRRLPTSNFGVGVDVYINGTNRTTSSRDLFGPVSDMPFFSVVTASTSVAAPRMVNKIVQKMLELRKTHRGATSLDAWAAIRAESTPLRGS